MIVDSRAPSSHSVTTTFGAFAKAFDGHPRFAVPKVVANAPKVVVTEWLDGARLSTIIAEGTREQRDSAGALLAEFNFSSPSLVGLLHGDPHPGNFMLLADGRLGVIDYGACVPLPNGLPKVLGRMVRLGSEEKFAELTELLHEYDFVSAGQQVSHEEIAAYLRPFNDPMETESFHFTRKWLQRVAGPVADISSDEFQIGRQLNTPPEYVMIMRVLVGCIGICCQLDAEAPYRRILSQWLPGYADSADSTA